MASVPSTNAEDFEVCSVWGSTSPGFNGSDESRLGACVYDYVSTVCVEAPSKSEER